MQSIENSYQLMFADGLELKYINGTLLIDIFFPKSKGQLWYTYGVLFDNFKWSASITKLNAYSERDDEIFTLTEYEILINNTTMPFSFFKSDGELNDRRAIKCKSGYNVILVMTSCCESILDILGKRAMWFDPFTVEIVESPEVLVIDFTHIIDLVNRSIEAYAMDFKLTQNLDNHEVTLDVFASSWNDGYMDKYLTGTITFKSDLIDNMLYKKIKITAKHNLIFIRDDSTGHLRVVPLPIIVCPFSPVIVLDRHSVQENQVILFDDRSFPNYDLVKLDDSTLLITDVLSNAGKGLIFSQLSIPLLVVMVKNYKDDRMRTLMLKFERGVQFNMDQVDENRILKFDVFDKRFSTFVERMAKEEFILKYDTRIGINHKNILEEFSTTTPKATTTRKVTRKPRTTSKLTNKQYRRAACIAIARDPDCKLFDG
uniref:Uncharacterized protein n=1 Tax=Romanomermis culicivorax TaxID=13658 RepID=A0A915KGJ4_ROMCU